MRPSERHDPERFYHCDCLDEEGGEHDDRFYHCDCLEGGYDPEATQAPGPATTMKEEP